MIERSINHFLAFRIQQTTKRKHNMKDYSTEMTLMMLKRIETIEHTLNQRD